MTRSIAIGVVAMALVASCDGDGTHLDAPVGDGASVDVARADAAVDALVGNACKAAGGICLGAGQCAAAGATRLPAGDGGCPFTGGGGECCRPPVAQPSGDSCAERGGLCAPISGCNFVDGAVTGSSCGGPPFTCCVPETVCGVENVSCCTPGPGADFRAHCDRGTFHCSAFPGTTLTPDGSCT